MKKTYLSTQTNNVKSVMTEQLPFFNWSLKRALGTTQKPLVQAQIRIFYFVILINMVQILLLSPEHFLDDKFILGDIIRIAVSLIVMKFLLYKPQYLRTIIHVTIAASLLGLFLRVFLSPYGMSVLTAQHVFMMMILSFYGINKRYGLVYSILASSVILSYILINLSQIQSFVFFPSSYTVFGNVVTITVTFIVIIYASYYYQSAFNSTIEETEELNVQLNKLLVAKSDFLSTMSHELRTPLNSVIGMSNLLIESNHSEDQKENLDALKFSAESLLVLINDILDFNKIESGKIELEKTPFNLSTILERSCASLKLQAIEKGLMFDISFDKKVNEFNVLGDPTRLTQILLNLVSNAIKFTKTGSVKVSADVLDLDNSCMKVRFSVKDTGIGVGPDQQESIFELFTQASTNITRRFGGTGLGLAIVKHLVFLHQSEIKLLSVPDEGSTFYFDFSYPISSLKAEEIEEAVSLPQAGANSLSGLRILVAEDNAMNVFFMVKLLSAWGADLVFANNGKEVLDILKKNEFDVILMDLHMPIMGGLEATQRIRKMADPKLATIRIIALTASVNDNINDLMAEFGLDDYIIKPFQSIDLYEKLADIKRRKSDQSNLTNLN